MKTAENAFRLHFRVRPVLMKSFRNRVEHKFEFVKVLRPKNNRLLPNVKIIVREKTTGKSSSSALGANDLTSKIISQKRC